MNIKEQFLIWLEKKAPDLPPSEWHQAWLETEAFCMSQKIISKPLFETTESYTIRKVCNVINSSVKYRVKYFRIASKISTIMGLYYDFIKMWQKQYLLDTGYKNINHEERILPQSSAIITKQQSNVENQDGNNINTEESAESKDQKHISTIVTSIDAAKLDVKEAKEAELPASVPSVEPLVQETTAAVTARQPKKKDNPLSSKMEQIVLRADMDGMSYDDLKDTLQITMALTKQLVAQSTKIVDIKGVLIHEEAFIDWEDGADELETIIEKLMQKNSGYISSTQLFEYARTEMNMFLNDNDMREERAVYDMAQHLFEKAHYHGKDFTFRGKMHISRVDAGIGSNMDVYKKYATDQGGVFGFNGLVEYLESIGVGAGNLRTRMRMQTEPIFFFYDHDLVAYAEALHIDDVWKKSIAKSLQVLFDDVGDHIILRNIPAIWFDRLPAISGNRPWTPLLLQSVLRFYSKELGARTIQALDGQSLETVHAMIVANNSPIQNFGDVIISYMLEQNIERRKFEAEELRLLLVNGGILHGNEVIWNMPKALKRDGRFAWDASGNQVTVKI